MKRQDHGDDNSPRKGGRSDAGWVALWGSAAALSAVIGLSSLYFGQNIEHRREGARTAAVLLPPPGDVTSTASIGRRSADGTRIEVYPSSGGVEGEQARRRLTAEVDALRREVAELRRTMAVLREGARFPGIPREGDKIPREGDKARTGDGKTPEKRSQIEAPAKETAAKAAAVSAKPASKVPSPTADAGRATISPGKAVADRASPHPGSADGPATTGSIARDAKAFTTTAEPVQENFQDRLDRAVVAAVGSPTPVETIPAPRAERNARRIDADGPTGDGDTTAFRFVHENPEATEMSRPVPEKDTRLVEKALPETMRKPVRIVALPGASGSDAVGSIPRPLEKPVATATDAAAVLSVSDPAQAPALTVGRAAGRISGAESGRIARTDFAIELGRFDSAADADAAWKKLTSGATKIPGELAHRLVETETGGARLLAGPFPNAADAATACAFLAAPDLPCRPVADPRPESLAAVR